MHFVHVLLPELLRDTLFSLRIVMMHRVTNIPPESEISFLSSGESGNTFGEKKSSFFLGSSSHSATIRFGLSSAEASLTEENVFLI